jgi:predicted DsbA family dithiol-disulfide isomerase
MDLRVDAVTRADGPHVTRAPFEIRPPPERLLPPDDPAWRRYFEQTVGELGDRGRRLRRPGLVPWTRKAHELVAFAAGKDPSAEARVRRILFRRFLEGGEDIGRVDVLLEVAGEVGFDATETKAVLDVDRHADDVVAHRVRALEQGVRGVPTLVRGSERLEGIHDEEAIHAFLRHDE